MTEVDIMRVELLFERFFDAFYAYKLYIINKFKNYKK